MLIKLKKGIKDPKKALLYILSYIKVLFSSKPEDIFEVDNDFFSTDKKIAVCIGFNPWKREYFREFLRDFTCVFVKGETPSFAISSAIKQLQKPFEVFIWSYLETESMYKNFIKNNISIHRVEDGFIRSVGLGSDKVKPLSLVIDDDSLYFNPRVKSKLEEIIFEKGKNYTQEQLEYARVLIDEIVAKKISKYNFVNEVSKDTYSLIDANKKTVLVIGQVEDDMSIRLGYDGNITNLELLRLAKKENTDATILFKPHPDIIKGNRKNTTPLSEYEKISTIVPQEANLHDVIDMSDHIYTITSLSGFEALLRRKKVTCLGSPFYSSWGLTDDRCNLAIRRKKFNISLEHLFYAAYIEYPIYLHDNLENTLKIIQQLKREK